MNSNLKTVLIIVTAVVVVGIIFSVAGMNPFGKSAADLQNGSTIEDGDMSASSTSVNGVGATGSNSSKTKTTSTSRQTSLPVAPSDASLLALINTAKIKVPVTGAEVTLSGGVANYTDSAIKGKVTIGKILGKVATDSGYDVFVEMTVTQDRQLAEIKHVALFRNVGQAVMYSGAISIGDRVILNSVTATPNEKAAYQPKQLAYMISATGYNLSVSYLDRKNGEPDTATPTLSETVVLHVQNHILAR